MKADDLPTAAEFAAMPLRQQDRALAAMYRASHMEAAARLEKLAIMPTSWTCQNFGFAQETMLKAVADLRQSQAALEYLVERLHADE